MGATVMTGTVLRHQVEWAAGQIGATRLGARVILHAQRRNDSGTAGVSGCRITA